MKKPLKSVREKGCDVVPSRVSIYNSLQKILK
ncbi:hypothetical protein NIES4074_45280 [Cylindrospermum sp. NIES-4074]|nr:hypothetical protein NIES4074_45280 [Cylindrospermum sp. NIES-4074]